MFKLAPYVETKYEEFMKLAKPTKDTKLICVQIRLGGSNDKNHADDVEFNKFENIKVIWSFVNNTLKLNETYKIFITTDREIVEEEAIRLFGSQYIVINKGIIKHIDKDLENQNETNCSLIEKTILDFHSMQNCDQMVITFYSGFGLLGSWLKKVPFKDVYVYKHPNITLAEPIYEKFYKIWI
jgi:hypothetical protein